MNSSQDAVPVPVLVPSTNKTITSTTNSSHAESLKVKPPPLVNKEESGGKNHTNKPGEIKGASTINRTSNAAAPASNVPVGTLHQNLSSNASVKANHSVKGVVSSNYTASLAKKQSNNGSNHGKEKDELMESLIKCDFFDGEWVKDDSYPLYQPGSCTLIDEQFNCIGNGRPDKDYQKYKWKPKGCSLPRYVNLLNLGFCCSISGSMISTRY